MKKDTIEQLFDGLQGQLDVAQPSEDHKANFFAKLQATAVTQAPEPVKTTSLNWWKPLAIAASVLLLAGIFWTQTAGISNEGNLADVSPEMEQTQDFFTQTIEKELSEIRKKSTPQTREIVESAIANLAVLENNYKKLQKDLIESGEDKRVIYAMITNFQNRIDLLQQVLEQMNAVNELTTLEPARL
ncbi:hypothetical protein EAX61_01235 [Dokdonia sinensis]|uniref:DUF4179 domain-containing protein n=1 Tax=Dokdonia sinensis TaxID=2479847 RepID=A0A3M0GMS3_9FLAO|nr:hypothetical protein [Dokdonia sinensis]RMB64032.1 hypothetical protein EAX61_01235 [Dokdonia sinensis]